MFRNVFQPAGFITLLSSSGSQPAQIWSREGSLTRVMDDVLCYPVLELDDQAVSIKQVLRSNYIVSPANPESTLGIRLPHLLLTLRPLSERFFMIQVTVQDKFGRILRLIFSNFCREVTKDELFCNIPLCLVPDSWNLVHLNLADLVHKHFRAVHADTLRVQIHSHCRIRKVFFAEKFTHQRDLPPEFRLFAPALKPKSQPLQQPPKPKNPDHIE